MKIFVSAVSTQFRACREALTSDLLAIGCEVRVQEHFQQGPRTLIERLEEYIASCDRVIALIGDAYGAEAAADLLRDRGPRSYTQWEYFLAAGERLSGSPVPPKDLFVYFASAEFLGRNRVNESAEESERQQRFAERIRASGKHWSSFDGVDQLCRLVLRDGWRMSERPTKLPDDRLSAALANLREDVAAAATTDMTTLDPEMVGAVARHSPQTVEAYRLALIASARYSRARLDSRFTCLSLFVDGVETESGQPDRLRVFDDLRGVLAQAAQPAVVILGAPGSGKSTLLRRLEFDLAVDAVRSGGPSAWLSVFVSLSRYKEPGAGAALPLPLDWLAKEWSRSFPELAPFRAILHSGPVVLLLDGLNEIPHRDESEYRDRVQRWRDLLVELYSTLAPPGP